MQDTRSAQLLFDAAVRADLKPRWLTEYGLLEVTIDGIKRNLFMGVSVLNSALSSYLSGNKHATRVLSESADIPTIPYCLPDSIQSVREFISLHGRVVAKPTLGRRSEGVQLLSQDTPIEGLDFRNMLLEQFVVGQEWRFLVLNAEVISVHKKHYESMISQPKTHKRVAVGQSEWNSSQVALSLKLAKLLGLAFCAVDFIIDARNSPWLLEVNSAPAIHRFHNPDVGEPVLVAERLLEATVAYYRQRP